MKPPARAFIISDESTKNSMVYVSVDGGMGSDLVNMRVVEVLKSKYGSLYTQENIVISGVNSTGFASRVSSHFFLIYM